MKIFCLLLIILFMSVLIGKRLPIFLSAVLTGILCLLVAFFFVSNTEGSVISYLIQGIIGRESSFLNIAADYFINNLPVFLLISLLITCFEVSYITDVIAEIIVEKFGTYSFLSAIFLIGGLFSCIGFPPFVAFVVIYPFYRSFFSLCDIPPRLYQFVYFIGAVIASVLIPDFLYQSALLPTAALGLNSAVSGRLILVFSLIGAMAVTILFLGYIRFLERNGQHYELTEKDRFRIENAINYSPSRPKFFIIVFPMIVFFAVYNFLNVSFLLAVLAALITSCIFFCKYLFRSDFWICLGSNLLWCSYMLLNVSAIAGLGSILQKVLM